ncbi:ATP-dependent RNA helicase RhlB [hydrothermal vent metagenome]|uniref:ATP-dependent RNA helicase RhlB n=1 Tax=hydrothermal vent metagenome TaxID=652676 RepID=A0A3B1AQB3_9ZZZZ
MLSPMQDDHLSEVQFSQLNLPPKLLQGIEASGFSACTPIQAETLPLTLQQQDVAGQAQTGTGKTAAFLIACFAKLMTEPAHEQRKPNQPRAFILAPTRELAVQIHKDAVALNETIGFRLAVAYGGAGYEQQRNDIQSGVDILIGTPGRLIDYFKQHVYDLRQLQVLVLDEADRMFDLGFIKDIRYLLRHMPKPEHRLSMLFSATLSHRVQELAYEHMNNPKHVSIEPEQITADKVEELVFYPAKEEKIPLLLGLLKNHDPHRVVIFVNTKRMAEKIMAYLKGNDLKAAVLSGDVPQNKRLSLLNAFTCGDIDIMVATDVAARGLHIPDISHVINFDLPNDAEDYVHRIGRTARAGSTGDAISFACDEYVFSLPEIEEFIGHKIPVQNITADDLITPKAPIFEKRKERPPHHNRKSGGGNRSNNRNKGRTHHSR